MPSTYVSLHAHIVFATRNREPLIHPEWRGKLHAYMIGTLEGLGAKPLAVNGIADHVHMAIGLRGKHSVAALVREVKKSSVVWAKESGRRLAWQEGYSAFSISREALPALISYIRNQEEHHLRVPPQDELRALLEEAGVEIDERYFF